MAKNRFKGRSQGQPVAGNAKPGPANRKQSKRLSQRIADWNTSMNTKDTSAGGKEQRKSSGGFHCPGAHQ